MRGDVQNAWRSYLLESRFGRLGPEQHICLRKECLDRTRFLSRAVERSEIDFRQVISRSDTAAPAVAPGRSDARFRQQSVIRLTEKWIGNHERLVSRFPRNLHSEEIPTTGQVRNRKVLNQVVTLLVNHRGEGNEV